MSDILWHIIDELLKDAKQHNPRYYNIVLPDKYQYTEEEKKEFLNSDRVRTPYGYHGKVVLVDDYILQFSDSIDSPCFYDRVHKHNF